MAFTVGMKVVCVDNKLAEGGQHDDLTTGTIYIIRWVGKYPYIPWRANGPHVRLEGIVREEHPNPQCSDMPFRASRFRPVVSTKSQVSFTMGADPDSEKWDNRQRVPVQFIGEDR